MEVNGWRRHQLGRYIAEGERVIKMLSTGEVDHSFLKQAMRLLSTYLNIPSSVAIERHLNETMIQLAQLICPPMIDRGYWNEIAMWWPSIAAIAEQLPDPNLRVEIVKQLAITRNNRGEAKEAQRLYEQLINSSDFYQISSFKQADILHQIGVCYLRQGDYERAKESLIRCLNLSSNHNHLEIKAYAFNQLGNIFMFHGNLEQAYSYYQNSLAAFDEEGESDNLACVAYQSLGRLLVLQQRYEEAIPVLEKGLAIRRQRQDQGGYATNAVHLATAYLECGKLEASEELLNEALQICRDLNDRRGTALCHLAFGQFEAKRGNKFKAIAQYQEALDVLRTVPMPAIELQVLVKLLPQLLRVGKSREFVLGLIRLGRNLRQQNLSLISAMRLSMLFIRQKIQGLLTYLKSDQKTRNSSALKQ